MFSIPVRVAVGRSFQEGLRRTSQFERNTGTLNLNPSFFRDHLKVNANVVGSLEKNRFAPGQEGNAITFDPTRPVYDPESPFVGFF